MAGNLKGLFAATEITWIVHVAALILYSIVLTITYHKNFPLKKGLADDRSPNELLELGLGR